MATWESELPRVEALANDSVGALSLLLDDLGVRALADMVDAAGRCDPFEDYSPEGIDPGEFVYTLAHAALAHELWRRWDGYVIAGAPELEDPLEIVLEL